MRLFPVWFLVVPLLAFRQSATAQGPEQDRAPRFLLALDSRLTPVDIDRTPLLGRRLSLSLDGATIKEALGEIGRQSGLRLAYGDDVLPRDGRVHLRADGITVVAALTGVLFDTDVDVVFSPNGRATLVRRPDRTQGGTVTGRVTDAKSGQAILGASVVLSGTRWHVTTDENGAYKLADVAPGTYTLTVSRIGYAKQSQTVTVAAVQEVTVEVRLQLSASPLDAVVVTGTVVPTEVKALPTPISVIMADQIEQKGYQHVDQIFRGDVPGAIAWDRGAGNTFASDINIRGTSSFGTNYVKTYIDGVEVALPYWINMIDPNSIERIEVVRGPEASTIYGSDASGGVMQVFTRKGAFSGPRPQLEAKVSAGLIQSASDHTVQQDHSLTVAGGGPDFSYRVGGGYLHSGDWVPGARSTDASLYGSSALVQGPVTVDVSARYYNKTFANPFNPAFQSYATSLRTDASRILQQQTYGVTLKYAATPRWHHRLTLGYDRTAHDLYSDHAKFTTPADSFLLVLNNDYTKVSVGYNNTYSVPLGRSTEVSVTTGADHWTYHLGSLFANQVTKNNNLNFAPGYVSRSRYDNTGYFTQVQLGVSEALFITAGLRAEDNQNFGKDFGLAWAPRVGVSYVRTLGDVIAKARVAYGKAIRPPSPGYAETIVYSSSYVQVGNPNLAPEQQKGWDGGLDLYFGHRWSLEATRYQQTAIDLISTVIVPDTSAYKVEWQNVGRIKNNGWELQARLNAGGFSLTGTYSITTSQVQKVSPTYSGDLQPGDQMLHIPRHTAGATLGYALAHTNVTLSMTSVGSWTETDFLALYGYYYGGQPYRGSGRAYWIAYPSFARFNLSVSHTLSDRFSVFLQSANLTNTHASERDNSSVVAGRATIFGVRSKF